MSAMRPQKQNNSLASTGSTSYNKTNDTNSFGSYTGSSVGFNTSSNYLPGSASKKETFTPKPKVETAVKTPSIGETYREKTSNINAPLPRSKPQTQTLPVYKPEAPKLKLNLPNTLERDFAKGALGDEREREVYNFDVLDQAAKKGYLKDTRTEADFFRTGFLGLEDTPKYAFTEKADDKVKYDLFNLLDYKTPQSRIDAFKEIQERSKFNRAREAYSKLHNDTLPKVEETTQQGFINPAGTTANARLLNTFNSDTTMPNNPDATEFGADSETYKILKDLSKRWYATSDPAEKDRLHKVAEDVRMYHRQGTPIVDRHDAIMNLLHENKKTAQDYQKTMIYGIPGFLYRMSDGNYMLDSSTYLIGMVDEGEWDYKYNKDWQVKYDYFDGVDMDTPKSNYRNWKPWMYFDGYLISADKLGNMNMAYVGKHMGLAEWVYKNFETTDKDDGFWVQYGIDLANSGR